MPGMKHDTTARAGGSMRHSFGTDLPPADGDALVECLRTP